VPTSDEDFKGICVKPKAAYYGFTQRFEQLEHMGSKSDGVDSVIYSIEKFAALAADCNPSIIEVLHVADRHVVSIDEFGEELRAARDLFISKKAKYTFSGYAHSQLQRIKTHRAWLLDPPKAPPTREEFGLPREHGINASELGAYDSAVEKGLEATLMLPKDVIRLLQKEKEFAAAKTKYDQFLTWKKTRNPARAELEAKYGFDTKHGMHLRRLQRMAVEIMTDHKVYVDRIERGDRDEFIAIRNGDVTYDQMVEDSERDEVLLEELYKTSTLRREPDRAALDRLVVDITDRYLTKHG
jgi:predicted nucleotidyltransferase